MVCLCGSTGFRRNASGKQNEGFCAMIPEILHRLILGPLELLFDTVYALGFRVTGSPGLSIVLLSLAMNLMMLPIYRRADRIQQEEREQAALLKPGIEKIKRAFTGDERFMMLQTYYRQNGYKPYGSVLRGSLSLLLEVPFFMAAYSYLSGLSLLQGAAFGPIRDLGKPDALIMLGGTAIHLLPVLMTLISMISGAVYTRGLPRRESLQLYGMALIFLVLLYGAPSGLALYWTLNNAFSLVKNLLRKIADQTEKGPAKGLGTDPAAERRGNAERPAESLKTAYGAAETFGKPDGGVTDSLRASLTEEYQELYSRREALLDALIFQIFPVSRSQFEKLLDSDMSYDELLSSGGVLLCDTVWEDAKSTDLKAFREGITSVAVPVVSENGYTDRNVPVAGRYTSSDVRFVCSERSVKAIVPIENAGALFDELDLGFNTDPPGIQFGMNIREEDIAEVAEYLQNNYHDYQYWINIGETITAKRTLQALRIAGIALAAVIFTAALVNLVSTTAANAVNRRKELSMLRACGMSLRQIAVSLLFECVLFAAVTAAVSSLLGRKLADFLFMLISDTLIPALPWYAPALIGGAVLVLMLGSYLLPLRFAARQPISQEIRAKE